MKAIVTVKLPRNPKHNPRHKKTGTCPLAIILGNSTISSLCTDITGSHHSYIEEGLTRKKIEEKAKSKFKHITRIEIADEWDV